jgi:hypothetical protein
MRQGVRARVVGAVAVPLMAACSLVTSYDGLVGPGAGSELDASHLVDHDAELQDAGVTDDTGVGGGNDSTAAVDSGGGFGGDADAGLGSTTEGGPGTEGGPSDGMTTADVGANTFPGVYTCTATTTVKVTSPVTANENETLSGTVTVSQSGNTATAFLSIPEGGVETMCSLTFAVNGTSMTVSPANQHCTAQVTTPITFTATVDFSSAGTATINGVTLTSSLPYTLTGSTGVLGTAQASGTLVSTCTK